MKKPKCETCEYRGYSPEICKFHSAKGNICDDDPEQDESLKRIGKTVVLGAGAGVVAGVAGVAVAPIVGLKAAMAHAVGHAVGAKVTVGTAVGGGVAGAGVEAAKTRKKGKSGTKQTRRRTILTPLYLEE